MKGMEFPSFATSSFRGSPKVEWAGTGGGGGGGGSGNSASGGGGACGVLREGERKIKGVWGRFLSVIWRATMIT